WIQRFFTQSFIDTLDLVRILLCIREKNEGCLRLKQILSLGFNRSIILIFHRRIAYIPVVVISKSLNVQTCFAIPAAIVFPFPPRGCDARSETCLARSISSRP